MEPDFYETKPKPKRGSVQPDGPSLFDAPTPLYTMHRHPDRETSVQAGIVAQAASGTLKRRVYEAFKKHGAMTDAELASLGEFDGLPYTSVSPSAGRILCRWNY